MGRTSPGFRSNDQVTMYQPVGWVVCGQPFMTFLSGVARAGVAGAVGTEVAEVGPVGDVVGPPAGLRRREGPGDVEEQPGEVAGRRQGEEAGGAPTPGRQAEPFHTPLDDRLAPVVAGVTEAGQGGPGGSPEHHDVDGELVVVAV